jgi:hypothetical protein
MPEGQSKQKHERKLFEQLAFHPKYLGKMKELTVIYDTTLLHSQESKRAIGTICKSRFIEQNSTQL